MYVDIFSATRQSFEYGHDHIEHTFVQGIYTQVLLMVKLVTVIHN